MLESLYAPVTGFTPWNAEHYYWLLYGVVSTIIWVWWAKKTPTSRQHVVGLWMTLVGVVSWAYSVLVMVVTDQAPIQSVLPFHLCYFLNLLLPLVLWKRQVKWMDWIYPILMAGCLQALITPDLDEPFPHYYNVRYWLVHIMLIQSMVFMVAIYGFRPTPMGIFKCMAAMNLYALLVTPINLLFNTNFLYLRRPAPGSMMEFFGPWPQYIFVLEFVMLVGFTIVYLPFAWVHRSQRRRLQVLEARIPV